MDPTEQLSNENEFLKDEVYDDPVDDVGDPSEATDNEGDEKDSSDDASDPSPEVQEGLRDDQEQQVTIISAAKAHKPPKPSPLRSVMQKRFDDANSLSTTVTTTTSTSTSTSSTTGALHNVEETKEQVQDPDESLTLQAAMQHMQRMFTDQMTVLQVNMERHKADITADINERLNRRVEGSKREGKYDTHDPPRPPRTTNSHLPLPPSTGGPPPLPSSERVPYIFDEQPPPDRLRDQIAEMQHSLNAGRSNRPSDDGARGMFDNFVRQFSGDRFLPPAPSGPRSSTLRLDPRSEPFTPRGHYGQHPPSGLPQFNQNATMNNSIGSATVTSRTSNYFGYDRPTRQFAGQSFMGRPDDVDHDESFLRRTMRAIDEREATLGANESLEQARARSENLRRLNPIPTLIATGKGMKTLTKTLTTFNPWKDWWELMFKSCYLDCITMMERRLSPDSREGWMELDNSQQSRMTRRITYQSLAYHGTLPSCSKVHDTFAELNGVFLGVIDAFPTLVLNLLTFMSSSIDIVTMNHISEHKFSDSLSLRVVYFKALMVHTDPVNDARTTALHDFMQNTKYETSMSPKEFLDKTIITADKVDALFDTIQISDGILWTVVLLAIKKTTDTEYDPIVDLYRREPGFSRQDRNVLVDMFKQMDNKYKEKKKSNKSQHAMVAYDGGGGAFEAARYADGDRSDKRRSRSRKNDRKGHDRHNGERKPASELPCFEMQKTGKCHYNNCKFSHDKQVLQSTPLPSPTEKNMAFMANQIVEVHQALAAMKATNKKFKAKARNFKKQLKEAKKVTSTFQKATGTDKANAAVDQNDGSDTTLPQVTLDAIASDESDDDYSTTDSYSDNE